MVTSKADVIEIASRLPDPEIQPVMKVEEARPFVHLGRSAMYAAIAAGEIPSLRLGRLVLIPTAGLRRLLKIDD